MHTYVITSLWNDCELFRTAALIKVPEHSLKEAQDWAIASYCKALARELGSFVGIPGFQEEPFASRLRELIIQCNAHARDNPISHVEVFSIPVSEMPYAQSFVWAPEVARIYYHVAFYDEPQAGKWSGQWNENIGRLGKTGLMIGRIFVARDVNKDADMMVRQIRNGKSPIAYLTPYIAHVQQTVRHEIQHLIQSFIRRAKGLLEMSGLPNRKMRTQEHYDEHGHPTSSQSEGTIQQHQLTDIEFYTDLSDSIDSYKHIIKYVPSQMRRWFMKAWVGFYNPPTKRTDEVLSSAIAKATGRTPNPSQIQSLNAALSHIDSYGRFFRELRQFAPAKYQKAVKEFYKSVNP